MSCSKLSERSNQLYHASRQYFILKVRFDVLVHTVLDILSFETFDDALQSFFDGDMSDSGDACIQSRHGPNRGHQWTQILHIPGRHGDREHFGC